jgi:hypothetical protein
MFAKEAAAAEKVAAVSYFVCRARDFAQKRLEEEEYYVDSTVEHE